MSRVAARYKVLVCGDACVGKTSLVHSLLDRPWGAHQPTIGAEFFTKEWVISGQRLVVSLWDTAGQERFQASVPKLYYRGASGVAIVFDITDRLSFAHLDRWLQQARSFDPLVPVLILGNKSDQGGGGDDVSTVEAHAYARDHGCIGYHSVSAKRGDNVYFAFNSLIEKVWGNSNSSSNNPRRSSHGKSISKAPVPPRMRSSSSSDADRATFRQQQREQVVSGGLRIRHNQPQDLPQPPRTTIALDHRRKASKETTSKCCD